MTAGFRISAEGDAITCMTCKKTSHNLGDVEQRYCGHCRKFHDRLRQGWFGKDWGAAVCKEEVHIETPVGILCLHCDEPIEEKDRGIVDCQGYAWHLDCNLRGVLGGLNHLKGLCQCCGGTEPPDPPELTKREAAHQAAEYWRQNIRR